MRDIIRKILKEETSKTDAVRRRLEKTFNKIEYQGGYIDYVVDDGDIHTIDKNEFNNLKCGDISRWHKEPIEYKEIRHYFNYIDGVEGHNIEVTVTMCNPGNEKPNFQVYLDGARGIGHDTTIERLTTYLELLPIEESLEWLESKLTKKGLNEEAEVGQLKIGKGLFRILKFINKIGGNPTTWDEENEEFHAITDIRYELGERYNLGIKENQRIINMWFSNYREDGNYEDITEWDYSTPFRIYDLTKTDTEKAWVEYTQNAKHLARDGFDFQDYGDSYGHDFMETGAEWSDKPTQVLDYIDDFGSEVDYISKIIQEQVKSNRAFKKLDALYNESGIIAVEKQYIIENTDLEMDEVDINHYDAAECGEEWGQFGKIAYKGLSYKVIFDDEDVDSDSWIYYAECVSDDFTDDAAIGEFTLHTPYQDYNDTAIGAGHEVFKRLGRYLNLLPKEDAVEWLDSKDV